MNGGSRSSNPMGDLKNGLDFVMTGHFSGEAAHHAAELQKMIYGMPAASERHSSSLPKQPGNGESMKVRTILRRNPCHFT